MTTAKQWREAVRRSDAPPQVKLLCDYLSECMWQGRTRYNGIPRFVSVPREQMAEDLGVKPDTVKKWIAAARATDVLVLVRKGYEGRTSEYQGLMPSATRRETGETTRERGDETDPSATESDTPGNTKSNTTQRAGMGGRKGPLYPHETVAEGGRKGPPIVTHHSTAADGLTQELVEYVSPEVEEMFPDDPDAPRGTPADQRATGSAEVLEQAQQQRRSVQLPKSTPRRPPAGRSRRPRAHSPVAADSSDVTTQGEQAS